MTVTVYLLEIFIRQVFGVYIGKRRIGNAVEHSKLVIDVAFGRDDRDVLLVEVTRIQRDYAVVDADGARDTRDRRDSYVLGGILGRCVGKCLVAVLKVEALRESARNFSLAVVGGCRRIDIQGTRKCTVDILTESKRECVSAVGVRGLGSHLNGRGAEHILGYREDAA